MLPQFALIILYVITPLLFLRAHRSWGVPAAILSLWIPIEAGLFARLGMNPLIAAAVGIVTCIAAFWPRPDVFDVRKAFSPTSINVTAAVTTFLMFAVIAIPLGLATGFIRFTFDSLELRTAPVMIAAIFLFNALPEEILFRGLIQNWIEIHLGSRTAALLLGALIFGTVHLNNGLPLPNYKYMLMATIAGLFYGRAWRVRKNVLTSTITHTLVNTGWNLLFR